MPSESTIKDLDDAILEIEKRKRQIDEEHHALVTARRYFQRLEGTSQPAPEGSQWSDDPQEQDDSDDVPW